MIRGVVFDVGETLIDERGLWSRWADWLGVERGRFMVALCDLIERGEHHRGVFELFRPGHDVSALQAARRAAGDDPGFRLEDFYPDALPCLQELKRRGLRLGIAGNTSAETERLIERAGLPADFVGSSESWGVEKPSPAFFARVVEAAGHPARELAYVGDRLDNDVLPAMRAGLTGVFVRRGLWASVQRHWPQAAGVDIAVGSLAELPEAIARTSLRAAAIPDTLVTGRPPPGYHPARHAAHQ
jgi:FMN phosphatase YigB (HAD superfamily)